MYGKGRFPPHNSSRDSEKMKSNELLSTSLDKVNYQN